MSAFRQIPLDLIDPNPDQPRRIFDPDKLAELADSIAAQGLLQPITVRPAGGYWPYSIRVAPFKIWGSPFWRRSGESVNRAQPKLMAMIRES